MAVTSLIKRLNSRAFYHLSNETNFSYSFLLSLINLQHFYWSFNRALLSLFTALLHLFGLAHDHLESILVVLF